MEDSQKYFNFDIRPSNSPFIESIWQTQSQGEGAFISTAETHWELVVMKHKGQRTVALRGPETKARYARFPMDAEFFGIVFKHGAFMPHLPVSALANEEVTLPQAMNGAFWLHGAAWELPQFENADVFVTQLVRQELLVHDPVVEAVLGNRPLDMSLRTVQRRFLRATGLTRGTFEQIKRAQQAVALLQKGTAITDTIFQAGYADQPHLTRSLKRFVGHTPGQILLPDSAE